MAIKLHGRIIGRLDQIRIYYYIGAILFRYSIIEEWVVTTLSHHIYVTGHGDKAQLSASVKDFTDKFRSLSFGQKIQYLRGSDILRGGQVFIEHSKVSKYRLGVYKQCSEYARLMTEIERVCTERNQFIHTSYFQGTGARDWKMKFSSWRPLKKDGEFLSEEITLELMKEKYRKVVSDWKLVQKLNMELTICFINKMQALETHRN